MTKTIIVACGLIAALSVTAAAANPLTPDAAVPDAALARVKGSGIPAAPQLWDFWLAHNGRGGPPMDIVMRTLYENWSCGGCHPPGAFR
jgi:hypothetical protein